RSPLPRFSFWRVGAEHRRALPPVENCNPPQRDVSRTTPPIRHQPRPIRPRARSCQRMAHGGRGMTYIHRTMVVPAEHAPLARSLAAHLAGPPGDGMWVVGLSEDGSEPATHYVSSGPVGAE